VVARLARAIGSCCRRPDTQLGLLFGLLALIVLPLRWAPSTDAVGPHTHPEDDDGSGEAVTHGNAAWEAAPEEASSSDVPQHAALPSVPLFDGTLRQLDGTRSARPTNDE
jgi:hypothetical protein